MLSSLLASLPLQRPAPLLLAATPQAQTGGAQTSAPGAPFSAQQLEELLPATVYFRGKVGSVQLRNAGGTRFRDGGIFLAAMVDTSGYASAVQDAYQFYLLSEGPVLLAHKALPAGAYGAGIVHGTMVIMDIGGHTVLTAPAQLDSAMARPRPLQVVAGTDAGVKLYLGRQWVSVAAAPPLP